MCELGHSQVDKSFDTILGYARVSTDGQNVAAQVGCAHLLRYRSPVLALSKPGVIGVASSTLSALARAISSCGLEMSAGVILFITYCTFCIFAAQPAQAALCLGRNHD